jgi:hypothetical protein
LTRLPLGLGLTIDADVHLPVELTSCELMNTEEIPF